MIKGRRNHVTKGMVKKKVLDSLTKMNRQVTELEEKNKRLQEFKDSYDWKLSFAYQSVADANEVIDRTKEKLHYTSMDLYSAQCELASMRQQPMNNIEMRKGLYVQSCDGG